MALVSVLYWSIRATIGVLWCGKHVLVHWDQSEKLFLQKKSEIWLIADHSGPNFWLFCKNKIDENWQYYQFYSCKKVRNLAPVVIMQNLRSIEKLYWLSPNSQIWQKFGPTQVHPLTLRVCPENFFTDLRPNTIDFATCHRTHQDHNMDTWMIGRKTYQNRWQR